MREDDMTKEFFESAFGDRIPGGRLEEIDLKQVEYCGDGYMSQTYRLTAIFSKKGEPRKEYKLFVKSPFYNPKGDAAMRAGLTVECGAFIKEGTIYKQLLPAMTVLLKSKGVTEELPWADCWAVTDDGTMILEDLCSRGYKMRDQAIGLDMEHTTAAIKSIAKFHALSRVLRDQGVDSDIYERSYFDKDNLSVRQLFTYLFRTVADEVAKEDDEKWRDIGEQLQAIGEDLMGHFDDELECGENDFDVLNHCDFRTSNMMFKYEEDGSLADLKLIDFQVVHRNTFAIDFSVLLYTSASEEVRSCRVDDLLAIYRETVVETLELCGRAADDVPPLAELRAALEKKRFYGVIVGLAACLVSRVEQGIPLDVTERVLPIQHLVRSPSVWEHVKDILRPHLGKKLLDLKPKKE